MQTFMAGKGLIQHVDCCCGEGTLQSVKRTDLFRIQNRVTHLQAGGVGSLRLPVSFRQTHSHVAHQALCNKHTSACFSNYYYYYTLFLTKTRCVCRQAAVKAAEILPLDGLARFKQDPINRGHGVQYLHRPPPPGAIFFSNTARQMMRHQDMVANPGNNHICNWERGNPSSVRFC